MNPIIENQLSEFTQEFNLNEPKRDVRFEHFLNHIVLHPKIPESFDYNTPHTGDGEFGIDGVAIIINDKLIEDEDSAQDIIKNSHSIDVEVVFTQAKTSKSFDSGEILKFLTAVEIFFNMTPDQDNKINNIEKIIETRAIFDLVIANSNKCKRTLPKLNLYYASTGSWQNDPTLTQLFNTTKHKLDSTSYFSTVDWYSLDAKAIRLKYLHTKNSISVTFEATKSLLLPTIPKSNESYLALISNNELYKIITDENHDIRKNLFFDNIRDYNPKTDVNSNIKATLLSDECVEFPFKNNGITIVTKIFHRVGDKFTLEDFQIVNGCQTSHVVHECQPHITREYFIPTKIICTEDEELTERIIISSNSQNEVTDEMFWSLKQVHKDFEMFFKSKPTDQALYYERRAGQYNNSNVEKVKIITKDGLLKSYSSMFLEEPNKVGRHYGDLIPLVGNQIFNDDDAPYSYYTAAFAAFRLEWLFRNYRIDKAYKPFRYLMLMASRLIIENDNDLNPKNFKSKSYCQSIDREMLEIEPSMIIFLRSIDMINKALSNLGMEGDTSRRVAKLRDVKEEVRRVIKKP